MEMWKDVTAAVMSGEEDVGNNTFKVYTPEWRSDQLNILLKNLGDKSSTRPTLVRVV